MTSVVLATVTSVANASGGYGYTARYQGNHALEYTVKMDIGDGAGERDGIALGPSNLWRWPPPMRVRAFRVNDTIVGFKTGEYVIWFYQEPPRFGECTP